MSAVYLIPVGLQLDYIVPVGWQNRCGNREVCVFLACLC